MDRGSNLMPNSSFLAPPILVSLPEFSAENLKPIGQTFTFVGSSEVDTSQNQAFRKTHFEIEFF